MAAASLVLGIVSLVIAVFFNGYVWAGALCGIVGIVLAVLARKQAPSGVATAGLVCSIVGTSLCVLFFVACSLLVRAVKDAVSVAIG